MSDTTDDTIDNSDDTIDNSDDTIDNPRSPAGEPTDHDRPAPRPDAPEAGAGAADSAGGVGGPGLGDRVARYVNYLVLVALVVLALVAGIQFYGAVSRTINQWVVYEYRSLVHGAFNLAVLLIAGAGISWQVRRVTS
ncbi:hypothetical protein [Halobaculum gomorrense]|uniref:DUF8060 domain-containing protein n=1 Tax=Halobaculum gomorrense TaxID=43928 RepID=A0A1M5KYE3_9EURY|nr:hypothetical protein [Halobaculum gomorrense]SHG57828.1 hypothetical protein SAMN05443636_0695 [Halobaculum gomorrense]